MTHIFPTARRWAWVVAMVLLIALASACDGAESDSQPAVPADPAPPVEVSESAPLRKNTVEVYFPSILGNGLVGDVSAKNARSGRWRLE